MSKPTTLPPPNITVTRADVHALPTFAGEFVAPGPDEGTVWTLAQAVPTGRPVWVAVSATTPGDLTGCRFLSRQEASVAERAFLWQTALASDAALGDIGRDTVSAGCLSVSLAAPTRHALSDLGEVWDAAGERGCELVPDGFFPNDPTVTASTPGFEAYLLKRSQPPISTHLCFRMGPPVFGPHTKTETEMREEVRQGMLDAVRTAIAHRG